MKISSKASKVFAAVLSGALLMGLSACGGGAKKSATAAKSSCQASCFPDFLKNSLKFITLQSIVTDGKDIK